MPVTPDLQQLIQQLQHPLPGEQRRAIAALEQVRDPCVLPELYLALRQGDTPREPLLRAMFRSAVAVPGKELDALWCVVHFGMEVIRPWVSGLPPLPAQQVTALQLAVLGQRWMTGVLFGEDPGAPPAGSAAVWSEDHANELSSVCDRIEEEPVIVALALWAMSCVRAPDAIRAFHVALEEPHTLPRCLAVEGLGDLRHAPSVKALCLATRDSNVYIRRSAVVALAKIGDPFAVPYLCAGLNDSDQWLQIQAAATLGAIGDPKALPALKFKIRRGIFGQSQPVSDAARAAVAQIEAQIGVRLPRPSQAPEADPDSLPRPSGHPAAEPHDLPRPTDETPA